LNSAKDFLIIPYTMRHRLKGRKLGRTTAHRKAMIRNMIISLFTYGRITTTLEKAKECRRLAERLITRAKKGGLSNIRYTFSILQDKKIVKKLFQHIAPRFADTPGGYTRILKLGGCRWDRKGLGEWAANRLGDNAKRVVFELVKRQEREEEMYLAGIGEKAEAELAKLRAEKKKTKQRG
jgi:large subunit ribosomal protein L17